MLKKLETLANIAILLFVVIAGAVYAKNHFPRGSAPPSIKVGDIVPVLPDYAWHSHRLTLVLALRYGCKFCDQGAPFYKKLVQLEQAGQFRDVHLLAIFPDDPIIAERTLRLKDLTMQSIGSLDFQDLKIHGTPTAIVVDNSGSVRSVWVGLLDARSEKELLSVLLQ